jgi:enterobacteria phage integrase
VPAKKTPATFHEIRSLSARLYADAYGENFTRALLGHKSARMTALYRDSRGQEWTEVKLPTS